MYFPKSQKILTANQPPSESLPEEAKNAEAVRSLRFAEEKDKQQIRKTNQNKRRNIWSKRRKRGRENESSGREFDDR